MIKMKMGQIPGDYGKAVKIAMMEGRSSKPCAKSFRKMVKSRERAVLKERTRREIMDTKLT